MTNLDRCYNIFDLREAAQRRLSKGIFEYVDKGTEDGISLEENRAAFQRIKLRTRFLNDWSERDLGTEIFGKRIELPFGIAPTGSSGLMWYRGEVDWREPLPRRAFLSPWRRALTSMEEISPHSFEPMMSRAHVISRLGGKMRRGVDPRGGAGVGYAW